MEMREVQVHKEMIAGKARTITTGLVENGWWWECPGFENSEGTEKSREAALKAAREEIAARTTLN